MKRYPDFNQNQFRWAWDADPRDDAEPEEEDDLPPDPPPPLRARVIARYAPDIMKSLWGTPVKVRKASAPTSGA